MTPPNTKTEHLIMLISNIKLYISHNEWNIFTKTFDGLLFDF